MLYLQSSKLDQMSIVTLVNVLFISYCVWGAGELLYGILWQFISKASKAIQYSKLFMAII